MVLIARPLSIGDEHWRASLLVSLGGATTSNLIAWAVNADWGGDFAASSIAITAVGGLGIRPGEVPISTQDPQEFRDRGAPENDLAEALLLDVDQAVLGGLGLDRVQGGIVTKDLADRLGDGQQFEDPGLADVARAAAAATSPDPPDRGLGRHRHARQVSP
jgi:hypothetical protein